MSVDPIVLGQRLKQRRVALGWSLADLAERTGLSRAYISTIERGKSSRPGAETIRKLEGAVGHLMSESRPSEASAGLAALAVERNLAPSDVDALAALRIRGRAPQSKERWDFIYQALLASESIDDEVATYSAESARELD